MGNPADHEARAEAERSGQIAGSDVDRIEDALLAETKGDDAPSPAAGQTKPWVWNCWRCGKLTDGRLSSVEQLLPVPSVLNVWRAARHSPRGRRLPV